MIPHESSDPLHGVTLERLLTELVEKFGWAELGRRVEIRCFLFDPSVKSSLVFLQEDAVGAVEGRVDLRGLEVGRKIIPNRSGDCLSSPSTLSALAEALHRFDPPWIKVGRIYRRVCFLRLEGRAVDARRLAESELAQARAEILAVGRPGRRARGWTPSLPRRRSASPAPSRASSSCARALGAHRGPWIAQRPAAPARAEARPAVDPGAERGIADFIDEMLAQDRAPARARPLRHVKPLIPQSS